MKLYTRTGDDGSTALFGGNRVRKHHPRVQCYGAVDEVNSVLGWAAVAVDDAEMVDKLRTIQEALFTLGAELASADGEVHKRVSRIDREAVQRLEAWTDQACDGLVKLTRFLLPGGSEAAARMHLARTVCRRAERLLVEWTDQENFSPDTLVYLNRLSDLLFAWARRLNHQAGVEEPVWDPAP